MFVLVSEEDVFEMFFQCLVFNAVFVVSRKFVSYVLVSMSFMIIVITEKVEHTRRTATNGTQGCLSVRLSPAGDETRRYLLS